MRTSEDERAACAATGVDPEWWWPESPDPVASDSEWAGVQRALALCSACLTVQACRALFASQPADVGGIWFGTTEGQRARARARKEQAA